MELIGTGYTISRMAWCWQVHWLLTFGQIGTCCFYRFADKFVDTDCRDIVMVGLETQGSVLKDQFHSLT